MGTLPAFPPLEVNLPFQEFRRLKELEEGFEELKKHLDAVSAWQRKLEFILEQNGINLDVSESPRSPEFQNYNSSDGMQIISTFSLSTNNPQINETAVIEEVGEDSDKEGEENLEEEMVISEHPSTLDESDEDPEIRLDNGLTFGEAHFSTFTPDQIETEIQESYKNLETRPAILDAKTHAALKQSNRNHVELPPITFHEDFCTEEEQPGTMRKEAEYSVDLNAPRLLRSAVAKRVSTAEEKLPAPAVTSTGKPVSRNRRRSASSSALSFSSSIPSARFSKDQQEAVNHIELVEIEERRRFKCKLCGHIAQRETSILTHIRMSHIGQARKHPCPHCSYRFKLSTHLTSHVQIKHPQPEERDASSLNIVLRREHNTYSLVRKGSTSGSSKGSSKRRRGSATTVARTDDELENEIESSYDVFRDNEQNKSYLCIACGFVFNDQIKIRQHILQSHKCPHCPEVFMEAKELQSHVLSCTKSSVGNMSKESTSRTVAKKRVKAIQAPESKGLGPWAFSDISRQEIDRYIGNIRSSQPPYVCSICQLIIKSTRQSARIHVRGQHPEVLEGLK